MHVTNANGTDIVLGVRGRMAKMDDGDFSRPGMGGNLPAGEVFVSPENGTAEGTIVLDGSVSVDSGDIVIGKPITLRVPGFVSDISAPLKPGKLWPP
jgi:leucyl aminopeptidase (aminopeptidase T)